MASKLIYELFMILLLFLLLSLYNSNKHIIELDTFLSNKNELKNKDLAKNEEELTTLQNANIEIKENKTNPKYIVISIDGLRIDFIEGLENTIKESEKNLFTYQGTKF